MTFDEMLEKLASKENFHFPRFGDGEWAAILGHPGENCDGHRYFRDMGRRLGDVLQSNPPYPIGMQHKALKDMGVEIANYINTRGVKVKWINSDIIHAANEQGRMGEMVKAMENRKVVLVGPKHLFNCKLPYEVVVVPPKNCWKAYEPVKHEVLKRITKNTVVLYCCSMMAEVLIDDMWLMYGDDITQIDVGSALDVHAGKPSRRYQERMVK